MAKREAADGSSMKGWPYTDFATGWYQIGYSAEFKPGDIKAAKWLDQDLALFRTESGKFVAMDAYCPHMGAHLGKVGTFGGKVCGESIACPWHGWRWDTTGANVEIPYRPGETSPAKTVVKHTDEIDGLIFLWYDSAGRAPLYHIDSIQFLGDKSNYYPIDWTVAEGLRVKPQMLFENSADPHHFPYVHGSGVDADFGEYKVDGPLITNTMYMKFGAGKPSTWMTPNGPVDGAIDNFCWGVTPAIARFNIEGRICIHVTAMTPNDHELGTFFSTVTHSKEEGDNGDVPKGIAKKMMEAQHVQIQNDFHIWQNMMYRVRPIFTGDAEKTRYAFLRKHLDQFYPNSAYDRSTSAKDAGSD